MRLILLLALLSIVLLSCGPTEKEINKMKKEAYEIGVREGKAIGERAAAERERREGMAEGYSLGFGEGVIEGWKQAFIRIAILGIKRLYPEAIMRGAYLFIVLFVFSVLWKTYYPWCSTYLAKLFREFRWSVMARMKEERKLKAEKEKWEIRYKNVVDKSILANEEIKRYGTLIEKYQDFIKEGIPLQQVDSTERKIELFKGKIKVLEKVIQNGENHKADIDRIKRGLDLSIFTSQNGSHVSTDALSSNFQDIQEDIKMYLKFDVYDISDGNFTDYSFSHN